MDETLKPDGRSTPRSGPIPPPSGTAPRAALLVAWAVAALLAAGCLDDAGPHEPGDAFRAGGAAYLAGETARAARLFARAAETAPSTGARLAARHWEGMSLLEEGQTREARARFDEVLAATPEADLAAAALLGKARSFALERRTDEAAALYERLLREHPDRVDAAAARAALRALRGTRPSGARPDDLHTVQAGAFAARDRAEALRRRLLLAGFDSYLSARATNRGALHVVQTGAFSTRRAAESHARTLREHGFEAAVR